MRGEPWRRRMLETQLASWAQLRRDTILYAKESFTSMPLCAFPDGYVDPYPEFYAGLEELAKKGGAQVAALDFDGGVQRGIAGYFAKLGEVAGRLREIARREQRGEPPNGRDLDFINHLVSAQGRSAGCTIIIQPRGWYADLYYDRDDVWEHEPTIADVHTQPAEENGYPVGKVLHVGTCSPRLLAVDVESCGTRRTFRGYVASYYEKITTGFRRLDDGEWSSELGRHSPPEAAWLRDLIR
jgi:hypothetical protein